MNRKEFISRQYLQRLLEDFYDDRPSVLALLEAAQRIPADVKPTEKSRKEKKAEQ